jgi:hypothetical protein
MALANFMRLSLMKAAHADVDGAAWQEIRVAYRFRPTYAPRHAGAGVANVGHPSSALLPSYFLVELSVKVCGIPHLAKNERDAANFLHAALGKTACTFLKGKGA